MPLSYREGTVSSSERTWTVEKAMPTASTGTTVPNITLQRRGVITIAPRVVMVVIITDRAT